MKTKYKIFLIYFLLLLISQGVQLFLPFDFFVPELLQSDLPRKYVNVPAMTAKGAIPDKTIRMAYMEEGEGEYLILIHGNPGSGDNFRFMMNDLSAKYHVISPDIPGFGYSSHWIRDYGVKAQARYVLALMDKLKIQKAHVLGWSMGSGAAQYVASLAPDRVQSLIYYGGIGIQDGEGSGDYYIEHFKYAIGYGGLVVLPEIIPHFGFLGPRYFRHSMMRTFWDSDQRPFRKILESSNTPTAIIQGVHDPLVRAGTAREHHRLIKNSDLIMLDESHFMPMSQDGSKKLNRQILGFLNKISTMSPDEPYQRVTNDLPNPQRKLPIEIDLDVHASPWLVLWTIFFATFISEDLTIISVGILAGDNQIDLALGIMGCFFGIFVGDMGLWIIGALIRPVRHLPLAKKIIPEKRLMSWQEWFNRYGGKAIFLSRFIPGTRFITYLGAGLLGLSITKMMWYAALAGIIWSPVLVVLAAVFGPIIAKPFKELFGTGIVSLVATLFFLFLFIRILTLLFSTEGRNKLKAFFSRFWKWEFWPTYIFYIPLAFKLMERTIRYGKFTLFTASNPGIPMGGTVGESKLSIQNQLPEKWTIPSDHVELHKGESRMEELSRLMKERGWNYPLILKPDAGQRGAGVKLIRSDEEAEQYLDEIKYQVLVQPYHPGPYEAGIFYYRLPNEKNGRIASITDKIFPLVEGDGESTLRELIWGHPRYRMQGNVFMKRFQDDQDRIPKKGEIIHLAIAGNHAQGTRFLDGAHLITPQLEQRIDEIAKSLDEFYIGRFDVRYSDVEKFKQGKDLAIVELNGALGETTNIYDSRKSLWEAYSILFQQVDMVYEIGYENMKRGFKPTPYSEFMKALFDYYRGRRINPISD